MFAAFQRRGTRGQEEGFTLIELMVVVLIMAILMAIAIPTFLGAKNGANDRAAQSNLTNALTAAKTLYANTGSYDTTAGYSSTEVTALQSAEPSMTFVTTASTKSSVIGVQTDASGQALVLNAQSATGSCWWIADIEASDTHQPGGLPNPTGAGTYYGQSSSCSTNPSGAQWQSGTTGSGFQGL